LPLPFHQIISIIIKIEISEDLSAKTMAELAEEHEICSESS
jgi:hypothetical protein